VIKPEKLPENIKFILVKTY